MNRIPLILVGGGGHCRSCIDAINLEGKYVIEGILDNKERAGKQIDSYAIIGSDELIEELAAKGHNFLITVGQIKSADVRLAIYKRLKMYNALLATVISPKAYVAATAQIKEGTIILHGSVVNADASIGVNSIINSMSLIEHDAVIGNHTHISTGAIINGGAVIGDNTFIGSGAVVANNIHIAENIVIGAGSVVVKNIMQPGVYVGNPCKKIKT